MRQSVIKGAAGLSAADKAKLIPSNLRKGITIDGITGEALNLYTILNNPNPFGSSTYDNFGYYMATYGDYLVVSAYREDEDNGENSGKVYVFSISTGNLLYTINNPNVYGTSIDDNFGDMISMNSQFIAISATLEDEAGYSPSGRVYIFDITNGTLLRTITNPNVYGTPTDNFGAKTAIYGNYLVISANNEDDSATVPDSGRVYIFDITTGTLLRTINNPGAYSANNNDFFGSNVDLNDTYLAVGAPQEEDPSGGTDSGRVFIFDIATGALLRTINNPNAYGTVTSDGFGWRVFIFGNYLIIGVNSEDDAGGTNSGKVYVFDITTGVLLRTINNPTAFGTSDSDSFGYSLGLYDNYLAVSAFSEDDAGGLNSGKVYVFDITTGDLLRTIDNPNAFGTSANDSFGRTLVVNSNKLIVNAYQENDANGIYSGKVYVFDITTGTLLRTINNPNAYISSANDYFAYTVAIDGNYAIVGTRNEGDIYGTQSGKVYVFDVNTGDLLRTIDNPNAYTASANDFFGQAISISGRYLVVGAQEDDAGGNSSGKVYVFDVNTGALLRTIDNPNAYGTSSNDNFGYALSVSGNYLVVGAYQEDDAGGGSSGKVYIFNVTTGVLISTLNNKNPYGTGTSDFFGFSVAVSGNYIVIGAYGEDESATLTSSGKVYVFDVTGSFLRTINNPSPYGTSANDQFGFSVAISGKYAIIGAPYEDDATGSDNGKAYIFDVTTGTLLRTLNNPNAYISNLDMFGQSVAISGNYAIVGAYKEDDAGGTESGKAYIFDVTTGALLRTLNNPNVFGTSLNDQFSYNNIAISGNHAIVGAYIEDEITGNSSGKAYIFKIYEDASW